jgi:hypothetical protein
MCDLAYDLAAMVPHLPLADCRVLIDFTQARLPMVLTFDTLLSGSYAKPVERRMVTVVTDWLVAPRSGQPGLPGRVRVRYAGFGHDLYLSKVRAVQACPTVTTYHEIEQESGGEG